MTEITDKAWEKINTTVRKYPEGWKGGVCAFQMLDRTTGDIIGGSSSHGACHAALNIYNCDEVGSAKKRASVVVNAHRAAWQKDNPEFLRWIARESPFAHGVLNKDNEDELFNHASVIDVEAAGNGGALWTCKAFRHFEEDRWKKDTWTKLRECGLDGLQAFIGASILDDEGQPMQRTHVGLFAYDHPTNIRKWYDEFQKIKRIDGNDAARFSKNVYQYGGPTWGSLKFKTEKKSDGWGGFIEVKRPCDVKEYAEKLREIFNGDPANVK